MDFYKVSLGLAFPLITQLGRVVPRVVKPGRSPPVCFPLTFDF